MPSRPWYKWYPGDYLADTLHLTLEEDAVYRRLLDAMWIYGPLPEDLGDLARICRIDRRKMSRTFAKLRPLVQRTNGQLYHPKIAAQAGQAAEISEKRRNAAKTRHDANAEQMHNASRARVPDPDPDPDKEQPLSPKGSFPKNGFQLPDWVPPEAWARWEDMRQQSRHKLTAGARDLALRKLEKLWRDGHQPGDVLDQSTLNGWRGLFPIHADVPRGTSERKLSAVERCHAATDAWFEARQRQKGER